MYKTLSLEEIDSIKSPFFSNLKKIYEKEGFAYFKQFIKKINEDIVDEILYFSSWSVYFRIILKENNLELIDETQAIRLKLDEKTITALHNRLKKKINNVWKKNIANTLIEQFENENMSKYLWKHFLVYDIETIGNIQNLKETKFMVGYVIDSKDFEKWEKPKYKYISQANLDKFVKYLLDYDGYIVWYNNVWFDNPVIVYNSSFPENEWEKMIETINKKSLDLFFVYSKIFWKRIGLNAVATHIVWVSKTLSSGAEWMQLLKEYEQTNDAKLLNKVKNYCKNDVKMTLTILLYLIYIWKISYQEKDINIDIDYILQNWVLELEKKEKNDNMSIF